MEESTKIHSASELDEMLHKSRSPSEVDEERTMIGNSQELAARSMSVPDDRQVATRASSNLVPRTGPSPIVPAPPVLPADVVDEDDAFAPWDDAQQRTAPQGPPDELVAALKEPTAHPGWPPPSPPSPPPRMLDAPMPMPMPMPMPVPMQMPMLVQPHVAPNAHAPRSRVTVILVAVIVALLIGGVVGYRRILSLERELAATRSALDAANARAR
jgi:hypothetical protein